MAIIVGENSYITVAEADAILVDYFDTESWDTQTTLNKEKALKMATRNIDTLSLRGKKYLLDQELEFPRNYTIFDEDGEIEAKVKIATAVESLKILDNRSNETMSDIANLGITGRSIEGTAVSYSEKIIMSERKRKDDLMSEVARKELKYWVKKSFKR